MRKILKCICVVVLSFAICSCQEEKQEPTTKTGIQDVDGTIFNLLTVEPNRIHINSEITAKIDFGYQADQVSYGICNNKIREIVMNKSKQNPQGNVWSENISINSSIPNIEPGQYSLLVVAKPHDGTQAKSYSAKFEVFADPGIKVSYDRKQTNKEQDISITSTLPLVKADLINPDGTTKKMNRVNDFKYSLNVKLLPDCKKISKIFFEDELGYKSEFRLFVDDPAEKRIYCLIEDRDFFYIENGKHCTIYKSINLDMEDIANAFTIKLPKIKDEFIDSIGASNPEGEHPVPIVQSISPDKKYVFATTNAWFYCKKNAREENAPIKKIDVIYSLIYNTETHEYKVLGSRHKMDLLLAEPGKYVKEEGKLYFPVFWEDDKLLLVEQVKDDKIFGSSMKNKDIKWMGSLTQCPYASAKGVELSLKDFTLKDSDKVNPLRPWVTYANQDLGIIAYTSPEDEIIGDTFNADLPDGVSVLGHDYKPTIISDLLGTKTYNVKELIGDKLKDYKLSNYSILNSCKVGNSRKVIITVLRYEKATAEESALMNSKGWEGSVSKRKILAYVLDFDTGNLEEYVYKDPTFTSLPEIIPLRSSNMSFDMPVIVSTMDGFLYISYLGDKSIKKEKKSIGIPDRIRYDYGCFIR